MIRARKTNHQLMHEVIRTHSLGLLQPLSQLPNRNHLSKALPLTQLKKMNATDGCLINKSLKAVFVISCTVMQNQNQYQTS